MKDHEIVLGVLAFFILGILLGYNLGVTNERKQTNRPIIKVYYGFGLNIEKPEF